MDPQKELTGSQLSGVAGGSCLPKDKDRRHTDSTANTAAAAQGGVLAPDNNTISPAAKDST